MIFGISGYKRPECKTYYTLKALGYDDHEIVICTNDQTDYEQYKKLYPNVIYTEGDCVADNRNALLEYAEDNIVLCDDDISGIKRIVAANTKNGVRFRKITGRQELDEVLSDCFKQGETFGFYSLENAGFCWREVLENGLYSTNRLYQGGFCGFRKGDLRYDRKWKVLDDYELILRLIASGKAVKRRNDVVPFKGRMARAKGGYHDLYKMGIQKIYGERLLKAYKGLIKANNDYTRFSLR